MSPAPLSLFLRAGLICIFLSPTLVGEVEDKNPASVFTELFDTASSAERWEVTKGDQPFGSIAWSNDGETRGLSIVAPGTSVALAKCGFGTDPFDFWFDTVLTQGIKAPFGYNGFALALCSAPPGEMTEKDLALSVGFYQAGVGCALKKGPFYKPGLDRRTVLKFSAVDIGPRFEMSRGGAGGENFSIEWPRENLAQTRLRCHLQRLPGNLVQIEVYNADGDFSRPWWTGQEKIPDTLASSPINYVAVLTTEQSPDSATPPPARLFFRGRITNLRGWSAAHSVPEIHRYSASDGLMADKEFALTGANFSRDAVVLLNGTRCPVTSASSGELKAIAKGVLPSGLNTVQVLNGDQVASAPYEPGIYSGHYLAAVEPCEALPGGGDVVTVRGAGFDASTQITVNGSTADLVQVLSADAIKIKIPKGSPGPAVVAANGFLGQPRFGYAPHPYMVFKGEEERKAKRDQFNDPGFAPYRAALLRLADEAIAKPTPPNPDASNSITAALGAWCLTGDSKYKEAVLQDYRVQCEGVPGADASKVFSSPGNIQQPLQRSQFWIMDGAAIAEVYDAMFQDLTPEQRTGMEHYLDSFLAEYDDRIKAHDWWYDDISNPSNTVAVANGCGGTVALSLRFSDSKKDATAIESADLITKYYLALLEDGGCVEGNLYWDYGVSHQIEFGYLLENALGNDHAMLNAPRMQKMVHFVETQLGGDGNLFCFNDTQPWLTGAIPCALGASRFDQPLMRWTCDEIARRGVSGSQNLMSFFSFLLRDNKPMLNQVPDLPTAAAMPLLNWGVLRSNPQAYGKGLVVGVKGVGGVRTHHVEEDAGSFVLQSRGEAFLIDPGYFQSTAQEHTLSLIVPSASAFSDPNLTTGKGPPAVRPPAQLFNPRASAPLADIWASGDLRSITVDASEAYRPKLEQKAGQPNDPKAPPPPGPLVRRILVMDGEKAVVTLDQIEPLHVDDTIVSFYQSGFATDVVNGNQAFRIHGSKSDLVALFDGPESTFTVDEMKFAKDWVYHQLGVRWYRATSSYKNADDSPRIGLFVPLDQTENPPALNVKRTENHISVPIPGCDSVEFQKNDGKWQAIKPG